MTIDGGAQFVYGKGAVTGTKISSGVQYVRYDGLSDGTIINDGHQIIDSDGVGHKYRNYNGFQSVHKGWWYDRQ